jgi:threonine dehydrogenase-like Zn-dependent dehydrogenase
MARSSTRLAIVGIYRFDPPPEVAQELLDFTFMNRDHFHNQRLKIIGCSNDPREDYPPGIVRWTIQRNMEYISEKICSGDLKTEMAITHRFRWDELEDVYRRFVAGDRSMVGVVLHWDD